jgi:hypothetical protein
MHHTLRVEKVTVDGYRVAHHVDEACPIAVEQWHNHLLQFVVECCGIVCPLVMHCCAATVRSNGPPRNAFDVPLDPPAIQHTERWHAVERRFHTACAGRLQRRLRGVEPDVNPGCQQAPQCYIVIGEVGDLDVVFEGVPGLINAVNELLAGVVAGMRFARIDDLECAGLGGNALEPLDVLE